jgi:hypothetical protein
MTGAVINVGQTYIDDDGDPVTVREIRRSQGVVVLEGEDGTCKMSLDAWRLPSRTANSRRSRTTPPKRTMKMMISG